MLFFMHAYCTLGKQSVKLEKKSINMYFCKSKLGRIDHGELKDSVPKWFRLQSSESTTGNGSVFIKTGNTPLIPESISSKFQRRTEGFDASELEDNALGDSNNDRQQEMAAETGNTCNSETIAALKFQIWGFSNTARPKKVSPRDCDIMDWKFYHNVSVLSRLKISGFVGRFCSRSLSQPRQSPGKVSSNWPTSSTTL